MVWALFDAGWDFWALHSRLMFPAGLFAALCFTLPAIHKYQFQITPSAPAYALGGLTVLGMLGGLLWHVYSTSNGKSQVVKNYP